MKAGKIPLQSANSVVMGVARAMAVEEEHPKERVSMTCKKTPTEKHKQEIEELKEVRDQEGHLNC